MTFWTMCSLLLRTIKYQLHRETFWLKHDKQINNLPKHHIWWCVWQITTKKNNNATSRPLHCIIFLMLVFKISIFLPLYPHPAHLTPPPQSLQCNFGSVTWHKWDLVIGPQNRVWWMRANQKYPRGRQSG